MTTIFENKQAVQKFFDTISVGDFERAFQVVTDDVVWWIQSGGTLRGNSTLFLKILKNNKLILIITKGIK